MAECSLRHCQHRGAFIALLPKLRSLIAPLPKENNKNLDLKCPLRYWKLIPNLFIAPSPTAVVINKRPLTDLCAPLGIRIQIANSRTRWRSNFKGLPQHGGRADFSPRAFLRNFCTPYSDADILTFVGTRM
jgi:hypothetical protein